MLDEVELFEPDELDLLELELLEDEDELVEPDEEVPEEVEDLTREKLNDPLLPVPEVCSNSGTRTAFSREEY